jgi:hypothetical protein
MLETLSAKVTSGDINCLTLGESIPLWLIKPSNNLEYVEGLLIKKKSFSKPSLTILTLLSNLLFSCNKLD